VTVYRLLLPILAVLATSFSSAADARGAKPLTGEEIRAPCADNEMTATNAKGQRFTERYKGDGTFTATSTRSDGSCRVADTGRWTVEGDRFCRQHANWRDGRRTCGLILKTPDGYVRLRPGSG
jgi:hypothetical protein